MKKGVKKLGLSRETLVSLGKSSMQEANGGTHGTCTAWSDCMCTGFSACCSGGCGTQECF